MDSLVDLHLHSSCSDGTDSPEQLLEKVRAKKLAYFALTDHDSVSGCRQMLELTAPGEGFICGAEFSCKTAVKKCHILGYGFDCQSGALALCLESLKALREKNLERRLSHLRECFGIVFTAKEIAWLRSLEVAGKPHVASLLVKRGLAESIGSAIQRFLTGIQNADARLEAPAAIRGIHLAGGLSVWAHSLGGEGEHRLTEEEFFRQLETLTAAGLDGLECYYSRYSAEEIGFLLSAAKEKGLLVSCGSDYHGANKNIAIGQVSAQFVPVNPESVTLLAALAKDRRRIL